MCPYVSMFMMFVALWSVLNQRSPRGRSHIGPNTRQTQPWQRISKGGSGVKKNPKHPQNYRYFYSFNSTSASCALEDSATFTHVYNIYIYIYLVKSSTLGHNKLTEPIHWTYMINQTHVHTLRILASKQDPSLHIPKPPQTLTVVILILESILKHISISMTHMNSANSIVVNHIS